jgi:hypothetical protein
MSVCYKDIVLQESLFPHRQMLNFKNICINVIISRPKHIRIDRFNYSSLVPQISSRFRLITPRADSEHILFIN